ncbi:Phage anti-repressor protein [Gallibacterium anatis]|uniref:Phage anti-repressor protein n=1 Tax=Gallibacterium anatis TaxID=750 RepID=A0A377H6M5_9PAST|nr:antA/AntB antirepressor family protein [Gallibacterium anatis]KGQ56589.1 antirepressor [Gallibacterium anatis DSM 16844 = F 149]STO38154.1 Phage anti-repressor protein [Gallibacterium anatis]
MTHFNIKTFTGSLQNQTVQLINARELHEKLKIQTLFKDWIKRRITDYNFIENEDYVCCSNLSSGENQGLSRFWGGHNRIDYHITLDMAKELCMLERSELGQQARRYFIQMEKAARQLAQQQQLDIPTFLRQGGQTPSLPQNQITIDKDRYIALLESENSLLKSNHGKPLHPRKGQRLNEAEKSEIRRLYAQGIAKAAIARQINRSETAVASALKA